MIELASSSGIAEVIVRHRLSPSAYRLELLGVERSETFAPVLSKYMRVYNEIRLRATEQRSRRRPYLSQGQVSRIRLAFH